MTENNEDLFYEISKLIHSESYQLLTNAVMQKAQKSMCDDMYDAEVEYCSRLAEFPMLQYRILNRYFRYQTLHVSNTVQNLFL